MKTLSIDIETYSDQNLAKCGVYRYVESPVFQILETHCSTFGAVGLIFCLKFSAKVAVFVQMGL